MTMSKVLHFVSLLLLLAPFATPSLLRSCPPVYKPASHHLTTRASSNGYPANQSYYFDQLIDHTNPALGTFKQRYFFDDTYSKGQGSPIVLSTPGEQDASDHWTTLVGSTTMRNLMYQLGAAGIILEHRYWGQSSPYDVLSTENLKYLTLENSMEDIKYFVGNVKLPFAPSKGVTSTTPDTTPWVQMGCSYPGLLAAYIQQKWPDLFAASWSSSAPVQSDSDFWEYFAPIEEGMPKNCSKDAGAVVSYFDSVFDSNDQAKITELKAKFGMDQVPNDDFGFFMSTVWFDWQGLQAYSYQKDGQSDFYKFCDALETLPSGQYSNSPDGVGLEIALNNWASWWKSTKVDPYTGCQGGSCYSTYDYTESTYTDWTVSNNGGMRQWWYMVCTEFGWFQTGDPGNGSIIVSKYVTEAFNLRRCSYMFPNADGSPGSYVPDITDNNNESKGWNLMAEHLFVTNGQYDPWRSASLSSAYGPNHPDTPYQKVVVVAGGHHCWDWSLSNAEVNPDVKSVIILGLQQVLAWVQLWYQEHPTIQHANINAPDLATPDGAIDATTTDPQSEIDKLKKELDSALNSRALVYSSLAVNGALILGLVFALIMLYRRSKKIKEHRREALERGEKLGSYQGLLGGGGSRGAYKSVEQTQH
ncbi:hypothetical protein FRC02_004917 [Tulasnella sp. 418]|nr:hypothetical protein FRC02_004917 [Tulasnella sp. 418]